MAADQWEPDQIVLSTFPAGASRWLGDQVPDRLTRITRLPVEHVVGRTFDEARRDRLRYAALRREMGLAQA